MKSQLKKCTCSKSGARVKDSLKPNHWEANVEQKSTMEKVLYGSKGKMYRVSNSGEKRLPNLLALSKDYAPFRTSSHLGAR
jgi:hypothetical protein